MPAIKYTGGSMRVTEGVSLLRTTTCTASLPSQLTRGSFRALHVPELLRVQGVGAAQAADADADAAGGCRPRCGCLAQYGVLCASSCLPRRCRM
eukprot:scaffold78702_cov18-Tisochrysis_lutea.AAC.1